MSADGGLLMPVRLGVKITQGSAIDGTLVMSAVDVQRQKEDKESAMKALILFIGWCILFVLCWPLALLALILFPLVWLISFPLRLIGITLEAVFALLRALLFLPARLSGSRKVPQQRSLS